MVCLLFIARTAAAEIRPGAVSLSPSIGGYVFDGDQCLEDNVAYGLGLGYHFDEHWATELGLNYISTESDRNGCNEDVYLYHMDGLYHFMPSERLVPFIAAGVGGIIFDPDKAHSDHDLAANYGAGLKYFLTENVALRGDVRHVISFSETQNNLLYTVGFTFLFGGEKASVVETTKKVEPKIVSKVTEPKVEEKVKVVAAEPKVTVLAFEDIHFDFDKATLKPEAKMRLKRNIQILKDNPNSKVRIAGYTSASGSDDYNRKLSERRANAVKSYLIDEGIITPDRLSIIGYGESNPASYEASPKDINSVAAKSNMRVLFEIIVQ
jgi:OOP family OmpA-OmpF porin